MYILLGCFVGSMERQKTFPDNVLYPDRFFKLGFFALSVREWTLNVCIATGAS